VRFRPFYRKCAIYGRKGHKPAKNMVSSNNFLTFLAEYALVGIPRSAPPTRNTMAIYQIHILGRHGEFIETRYAACDNDTQARNFADSVSHGAPYGYELWQGERLIAPIDGAQSRAS
jgi:hypothetical protein